MACQLSQLVTTNSDILITGITDDSRKVKSGDLFLAYPGGTVDGRDHIAMAIERGAVAVLYEDEGIYSLPDFPVPMVGISQLAYRQSEIAAQFYANPSQSMTVIGVTGTNGKTSCTQFIAQALLQRQQPTAVIGTNGYGVFPDLQRGTYTTPYPTELQRILSDIKKAGVTTVAMEVSSHSLDQHRVDAVKFDIGVFTNLTRDHLDYHGDMKTYGEAKERLFKMPSLRGAVINLDDPFGQALAKTYKNLLNVMTYSQQYHRQADICVESITPLEHGFHLVIQTPSGKGELTISLLGRFNISNVFAVLGVLLQMNIILADALLLLSQLQPVTGRMETFGGGDKPLVVVDYSHTPDALQQALMSLREHCHGELSCVFGCGGDRDSGKRPLMGAIAERLSDRVILTNDNPRSEVPAQIIEDIKQGLVQPQRVHVEYNRSAAIAKAIRDAAAEDVILVAGKGHEDYQIIGEKTLAFSDSHEVIQQLQLWHSI